MFDYKGHLTNNYCGKKNIEIVKVTQLWLDFILKKIYFIHHFRGFIPFEETANALQRSLRITRKKGYQRVHKGRQDLIWLAGGVKGCRVRGGAPAPAPAISHFISPALSCASGVRAYLRLQTRVARSNSCSTPQRAHKANRFRLARLSALNQYLSQSPQRRVKSRRVATEKLCLLAHLHTAPCHFRYK